MWCWSRHGKRDLPQRWAVGLTNFQLLPCYHGPRSQQLLSFFTCAHVRCMTNYCYLLLLLAFSALTLLVGWQEGHLACKQEAQLSPRDRMMHSVSWNLANCHATVQKLLVRQVLNKSKLWSWRVKLGRCVINMCTQLWRVESLSLSYRCHKQADDGRVVDITCIPTTCCGEIF